MRDVFKPEVQAHMARTNNPAGSMVESDITPEDWGEYTCDCCANTFQTDGKDKDNFIFSEAKGETGICRDCHREEYGSWHTASELEDIRDNELEMRERDGE